MVSTNANLASGVYLQAFLKQVGQLTCDQYSRSRRRSMRWFSGSNFM